MAARTVFVKEAADNTAAWLAFVGAIVVALIAAGTAQWRLRAQLDHDRRLSDLGDLRTVVERYVQIANQMDDEMRQLRSNQERYAQLELEAAEAPGDEVIEGRMTENRSDRAAILDRLDRQTQLHGEAIVAAVVRLPATHPFVVAVHGVLARGRSFTGAVRSGHDGEMEADQIQGALARLAIEAQKLVGSKI
jgi:hypothetical protein